MVYVYVSVMWRLLVNYYWLVVICFKQKTAYEMRMSDWSSDVCSSDLAFSALRFDLLMFTGSPAVGAQIMAAAAPNLTPVTLELGGKCPVIVGDDADLDESAARLIAAKTLNGGQACLAPDQIGRAHV